MVNLAKQVAARNSGNTQNSNSQNSTENSVENGCFPALLWVLRDFSLQLESRGEKISAKQYLEQALEEQRGVSEAVESKNKTRRLLKAFFTERDCVTMVRPLEEEEKLQRLHECDAELRERFVEDVAGVRTKILRKARAKSLRGQALRGP